MALTPIELPEDATASERAIAAELHSQRVESAKFRHQVLAELHSIVRRLERLVSDADDSWWRGEQEDHGDHDP